MTNPISTERVAEIEQRLFILARMSQELMGRSQAYVNRIPNGGGAPYMHALLNIQAEQLIMHAEREVILSQLGGGAAQLPTKA